MVPILTVGAAVATILGWLGCGGYFRSHPPETVTQSDGWWQITLRDGSKTFVPPSWGDIPLEAVSDYYAGMVVGGASKVDGQVLIGVLADLRSDSGITSPISVLIARFENSDRGRTLMMQYSESMIGEMIAGYLDVQLRWAKAAQMQGISTYRDPDGKEKESFVNVYRIFDGDTVWVFACVAAFDQRLTASKMFMRVVNNFERAQE